MFLFIATPLGMFFAVLLDKGMRGTRFYQSVLYMPVVLSLAIVGFIWQLQYSPDQGLLNNVLGTTSETPLHRLAGQQGHQPLGRPRSPPAGARSAT